MRVVLVSDEPRKLDGHRHHVLGLGLDCAAADCVAPADLNARLAQVPVDLIVVFVGTSVSDALPVIDRARGIADGPVLAAGPATTDPPAVVSLLHAGAAKFLNQDRFKDDLEAALDHLQRVGAVKIKQGRAVVVTAVNPGSGVTTVASNLAVALARSHPGHVGLAELTNAVPELALTLDLECKFDLKDLARDWERMDAAMLRQALTTHASGVQVLAYPQETLTAAPLAPPVMKQFVSLLKGLFEFLVIDLGFSLTDSTFQAMNQADEIVVVTRLEVPSLRLTRLFLRNLVHKGIPVEKIRVVANRYGQSKQFPWKQAQEVLGIPVLVWLPEDVGGLNRALTEGQPLLQVGGGSLVRRFHELAKHLNGISSSAGTKKASGTR